MCSELADFAASELAAYKAFSGENKFGGPAKATPNSLNSNRHSKMDIISVATQLGGNPASKNSFLQSFKCRIRCSDCTQHRCLTFGAAFLSVMTWNHIPRTRIENIG
jgi:hypothetical protein